jgi:hypothetical protein
MSGHINKCWNIGPPRLANWLPKFKGIISSALGGQYNAIVFISNLGQIEKAFTPSVKPFGADFHLLYQ